MEKPLENYCFRHGTLDQKFVEDLHYSYYKEDIIHGPDKWRDKCIECRGKLQSPIPLVKENTTKGKGKMYFFDFELVPEKICIENDGYLLNIFFTWPNFEPGPCIDGGPLSDLYAFHKISYHWGVSSECGSEHTINGVTYPIEAQLMFFKLDYIHYEYAKDKADGLAIISIMFKPSLVVPPYKVLPHLEDIVMPLNRIVLSNDDVFTLLDLIGSTDWNFFTYKGSLTHPPCTENIQWIVADYFCKIRRSELPLFRTLYNCDEIEMADNFRELQKIDNHRVFYYNNMQKRKKKIINRCEKKKKVIWCKQSTL